MGSVTVTGVGWLTPQDLNFTQQENTCGQESRFSCRRFVLTILIVLQMSEAADQAVVEGTLADLLYHLDNEGKLPEFA